MTHTTTPATRPHVPPQSPPDLPQAHRAGDAVFRAASTASGTLILVILALVASFLLWQALPALTATPGELADEAYGAFFGWVVPFAFGTAWSAVLSLLFAVPVSIGIALFISHYAPRRLAQSLGYVVDLLAAVPSVVYGLWGIFVLAPASQPLHLWLSENLGWIPFFAGQPSGTGRTMLTTALVLGVMVLPIITSLCREVFLQAPRLHEEAALALGATRWEMIQMAVLPFARAGIVSGVMLGLGRALGETMAVAMVLSGAHVVHLRLISSDNPTTIAAAIALNFPEASGLKTNQLIAAGLVLFLITLVVNMIARGILARRAAFSGAN